MERQRFMNSGATVLSRSLDRRRLVATSGAAFAAGLVGLRGSRVAAAQDAPTPGGRVVIGLIQEPGQLNDFFNGQSGSFISSLACEYLFVPDAAGNYMPVLAAEAPTLENGGISEDFLTITYKLRDGLLWSDGEPFTAEDMKFTFDVYRDPGSTPQVGAEWDLMESVTVVDPLTVEVTMSQINPGYLDLFQQVLPRHRFESTAITQEHELARIPLGTGPFTIAEWTTGNEIILEKNPNFRGAAEGKPYLDGITVRVTPEKEAALASFINGELDFIYFIVTGDLPALTAAAADGQPVNAEVLEGGASVEWLWLNLGTDGDPSTPHPVLGDPAIREAIDLAVDRQSIIDEVLGGFGSLEGSFVYAGWAGEQTDPAPYDPEAARQVLDAAGWVPGDGDVREKDGVRASLRYQCIAGDQARELYQQVVQQNLKDVGIEVNIENVPSNTIFGSYEEGGLLARGNFDIVMSRAGYEVDPIGWVAFFTTAQITSETNPGGFTYSYYSNPEFDDLANQAASTLDQAARQEIYGQINAIFKRDRPSLPLYRSAKATAHGARLQGMVFDFFDPLATLFTAGEWYVTE